MVIQTIPTTRSDSLWPDVQQQAARLLQLLRELTPKTEIEVLTANVYILGFYWRCVRLFDGVLVLLRAELLEEAAILARSLFEESLRLQQLAAESQRQSAIVLGWAQASINQKRGLLKCGKSLGLFQDVDKDLASLDEERQHLQEYQTRHGVGKLERFLSVRDAAIRFDRKDDYWTYEWTHESVHGSDAVWIFARRQTSTNAAALHGKTDDPVLLAAFAKFAAGSVTHAAVATFAIFDWPCSVELGKPVAIIRDLLGEKAG